MANLKEIVEGSIDNIAQETIDENSYYNIDMADGGITNAQMASAIAHPEFFNVGDVYQCLDSGTYTEKHFYKFNGTTWVDVTLEWGYPMLTGASDPTTATEGLVNQLYRNTTSNALFVCTAVTSGTPDTYTWIAVGGGGLEVLKGTADPASAAEEGQLYFNTATGGIWMYYNSTKGWINISGKGGTNSYFAGGGQSSGNLNVVIGYTTLANNSNANVVIGRNSRVNSSSGSNIVLGNTGVIGGTATNAIQLGTGTNNTASTLQVASDNIYNHSSHTLTVQNITLNGTDINIVIDNKISSAVTTALNTPV